jgi:hypothetical protein
VEKIERELEETFPLVLKQAFLDKITILLQQLSWEDQVLRQAYHASAPPDWVLTPVQDANSMLQSMLRDLAQAPRQTTGAFPILTFVEHLAAQAPTLREELRAWVDMVAADLKLDTEDINQLRQQVQDHSSDMGSQSAHLLVQLLPQVTKTPTYRVRAWRALDYNGDEHYDRVEPVDFEEGEERLCTLDDLPLLLEELLIEAQACLWDIDTDLSIAFFVPRELLNATLDHWEVRDAIDNPIRIGTGYAVTVRSHERLSPRYIMRVWKHWKHSWEQFRKLSTHRITDSIPFCDHQKSEHAVLRAHLIREKIACLFLTFAPTISPDNRDAFAAILGVGTPIALWPRQSTMSSIDIQKELAELRSKVTHMSHLPRLVQEKRLEADGASLDHLGHHLALLWEDPYLLPREVFPDAQLRSPNKRK